jgi:hypothetical protein
LPSSIWPDLFANMPNDHTPEPTETTSQFEKLLAKLARNRVDFAVVGGLAVVLNGYGRVTEDADILVSDRSDNLQRLIEVLTQWGDGAARELTPADFQPEEGSIRVTEDFPLDIFTRMRGKTLDDFRPGLRFFTSDDIRIPYLGPKDLIWLKQDSWREKDRVDVSALREILEKERPPGSTDPT